MDGSWGDGVVAEIPLAGSDGVEDPWAAGGDAADPLAGGDGVEDPWADGGVAAGPLAGGDGMEASLSPFSLVEWSATASEPRWSVALGMSTVAPHLASRSSPMMQGSCMLANQNWCVTMWLATVTWRDPFPRILVCSPVTVAIQSLVGLQPCGLGPSVPGRIPGRTREIVDPVSTRALHGVPLRLQFRYSPFVRPRRPSRSRDLVKEEGLVVDGSSPVVPPCSSLTAAGGLGFVGSVPGSNVQCDLALRTGNILP